MVRSTTSSLVATIASSSSGFSSNGNTYFVQTTVPWVRSSSLSGYNTFFGTQSSLSGNQVRASIFGPSDQSNFGEKRGSGITSYTKKKVLKETCWCPSLPCLVIMIKAMKN